MRLRYLGAAMLCLAGCAAVEEQLAESTLVEVSNGVNIIVARESEGLWTANPQRPSAYRRWGPDNAAKDNMTAIEMHTGCKIDRNTLISYNYTVRTGVTC